MAQTPFSVLTSRSWTVPPTEPATDPSTEQPATGRPAGRTVTGDRAPGSARASHADEPRPPRLVGVAGHRAGVAEVVLDVVTCTDWLADRERPDTPVPLMPAPPALDATPGSGRRVALVGGGVDVTHPDLVGARVSVWGGGLDQPLDDLSTGYASLLVGQGQAHVRGLVPAAQLLVAAVPSADEPGADLVIARAVRWALRHDAEVLVLPFGRARFGRRVTDALHEAIAAGVRVFAAAGNLGPDVLAFPAAVTGVLAVTAHDDRGLLAHCSRQADLAAPGRDVPAAGPRRRLHLQGSGPAAVLAAGSHLVWCEAVAEPDAPAPEELGA